jgi:hypothetical protein
MLIRLVDVGIELPVIHLKRVIQFLTWKPRAASSASPSPNIFQ